ncbi:hypothetical protein EGY05_15495 [Chryseobacterium arthrosphaerae]|uniref:hypothetical protein n=1 Tax=Chryseobacterium arthrosphaerae TaxID=651561 RepID=UPI000F4DDE0B|nr:hypothetical protein [Chryseobacterium arthrosphaerae]AYZ13254.1 hypothetical protein EGY05_15495 [Chryseobacterium arthrosphaerae]
MNSFFKRIDLYDSLTIEINIQKEELIRRLGKITYKTNSTFISLIKDSTIPTRFEYRGTMSNDSFIIKRRRRFFDINMNYPLIKGNLSGNHDLTAVFIEFTPPFFQIFTPVLTVIFSLLVMLNLENEDQNLLFLVIPGFIIISQYFVLKREIRKGKYDFERELTHITRKYTPSLSAIKV